MLGRVEILKENCLKFVASFEQSFVDGFEIVGTQVKPLELLQVLELAGGEDGVELVAEQVVAQVDVLECILQAVQQPLSNQHHSVSVQQISDHFH